MLGDAGGAGRVVEGVETAVVQEEDAVGDVTDAGERVSRDDEGPGSVALADGEWGSRPVAGEQGVVDEKESIGVSESVVQVSRFDEERVQGELDRAGVGAAEAGEAVQQRGGAGAACTEHGDAFASLDVEAGAAQDPCAGRASGDAGGVAFPEGSGAKNVRHGCTVPVRRARRGTAVAPTG